MPFIYMLPLRRRHAVLSYRRRGVMMPWELLVMRQGGPFHDFDAASRRAAMPAFSASLARDYQGEFAKPPDACLASERQGRRDAAGASARRRAFRADDVMLAISSAARVFDDLPVCAGV